MLNDMAPCEELFHTVTGTAFADIRIDGHRETWPIRSKRFRGWLRRRYYQATGGAASAAEIRSALDLLEARAQFDGLERGVHVRIAEHAGRVYLDLADEHWRAVDIGPDGWRVIQGRRCASAGQPACCRCPCRSGAGRSKPSIRSSILRAEMTSY